MFCFFPKLFPIASKSNIKNTLQWSPHNHPWSLESQNLCGKFGCFGDRRYFPTWQSKGIHTKSTKITRESTKATKFHGFLSPSILEEFHVHHFLMFLLLELRHVKIDDFILSLKFQLHHWLSITNQYKSVMVWKHQGEIPQTAMPGTPDKETEHVYTYYHMRCMYLDISLICSTVCSAHESYVRGPACPLLGGLNT